MIDVNSSEDAWSHLLDPGFVVNTYLNRLTRRDYVEIFKSNNFSVLEDSAINGRLGEKHLTDVNKSKLLQFDDYELFSNFVEFVLKKNAAQGA